MIQRCCSRRKQQSRYSGAAVDKSSGERCSGAAAGGSNIADLCNGAAVDGSSRADAVVLQQVAAARQMQQVEPAKQMQQSRFQVEATKWNAVALKQVDATEIIQRSGNRRNYKGCHA